MTRFALSGSDRQALSGAHAVGKADPHERLEVTVLLRRRGAEALNAHLSKLHAGDPGGGPLGHEEFERRHGADPADADAVRRFAEGHGLAVAQQHLARRSMVLTGTVAQFNAAFGVDLQRFEHAQGSYRGRIGPVQLPTELNGMVEAVLGLDDRPVARPHFRLHAAAERATPTSFTPAQLASLYQFPPGDGAGQTVAIIELGGGYRAADLKAYFAKMGVQAPAVTAVSVDHGRNHATGSASGPDGEVMLDIEVVGAMAPGAKIVVYFAPNTDAGFLDAISTAVHDRVNNPSVVSISWGGPESSWTAQSMAAYDRAFQAAAVLGVTVCAASGDNGSDDGVGDGRDHVDFPASSPNVLACGGTRVQASGGRLAAESVWNDGAQGGAGGGGISGVFALPAWQKGLKAPRTKGAAVTLAHRGVPDVAGDADPVTGYVVRVDGQDMVIGGTSAVAPLWAALVARINGAKGKRAGLLQPRLYAHAAALHEVTQGNNGSFAAGKGWDACTGMGSPVGKKVAALF